jgi:hypothetical protein
MKKILTAFALAFLLVGCAKEAADNNAEILEKLAALDNRVTALESSIQSIQSAVGDGKFVQKVEEFVDPDTGRTTGVTVTYTSGEVVHFNIVPTDPAAGPVFSVIKNGAGILCWAVDGVIIQIGGKDVPVYQTPVFSIDEDGNLWVEVDGEKVNLGPVKNEGATLQDGIFTDIKVEADKVVLTLSDGSRVNIPFAEAFKLNIETTEYTFTTLAAIEIPYTVTARTAGTVVGVAGYNPKEFSVEVGAEKIVVTPLSPKAAGVLLAYADSQVGLTSLVNITVEAEGVEVVDEPFSAEVDYMAQNDVVTAHVVSNVDFDVKPQEDWIHVVSVKSVAKAITFSLDPNTTGAIRIGMVNITRKGTEEVIQTITIAQDKTEAPAGNEVDLSAVESANSYLITKAGDYKFKAVKGNSAESVGAAAKAEVIWETENSDTAPEVNAIIAKVGVANGYVTFSTPATLKPGNALIAVKDASDVILWSWHIWIPATEVVIKDAEALVGAKMMDRNLGALVAAATTGDVDPLSIGLYYQWGRKDPFPGMSTFASNTGAKVAGTEWTAKGEHITTEYSIQHPTEYAHIKDVDEGVWNVDDPKDLWNTADDKKTIYDPCPAGYRVPLYDKTLPMWAGNFDDANWKIGDANRFSYGDIVFPIGGYIDCWSPAYEKIGVRTHIWASSWYDDTRSNCLYYRGDKDNKYYSQKFHKAKAGSVRCVADANAPVVPPADATVDLSKDGSANSYLITKAGDYKFKAVKGNSADAVGTVAAAEILWETENVEAAPEANSIIAKVGAADGYITFSTPETLKPGNAVIAAKDASDVILWSWHIWIPADEVKVLDAEAFAGAKMLDRNLGALKATNAEGDVDPLSIGLYFQWGRKDPFPGAVEFVKSPKGAGVAGTAWTYHKELITTEYSIQHPTEYASVPEVDAGVWNSEDPQDLWNKDDKKTIYDPCPAGYRVPQYDKSLPMWAGSDEGFTYETDAFRFKYGDFLFTVAGYIDCWGASYAYSNLRTHVWASSWYDAERSTCLYYRGDKDPKYYSQKFHKAKAGSVRCVAE